MKKTSLLLLLITGLLAASLHAEEVYRWVDEEGKVHFGDKPQGINAESIAVKQQPKIGSSTPAPTSTPISQEKLLNAYSERRKQKKELDAKEQQAQQKIAGHKKECDKLRDYLATTGGVRMYNTDENGEKIYLSDTEIDASRAAQQADLEKYCR